MSALSDLREAVLANTNLVASAKQLIGGIAERIAAAGTDQAALQALTTELRSSDTDLAQAIAANTPAAPVLGLTGQVPPAAPSAGTVS